MTGETERIKLDMSVEDIIRVLAGNNRGARNVVTDLVNRDDRGFLDLLLLDFLGIFESDIWMLYSDVCHENLDDVHACLLATKLGGLADCTTANLKFAIQNQGKGINVSAVRAAVEAHFQ